MAGPAARGGEDRKAVWSWCLYDWANSAFVTSITTVVLPLYYLTLFADKDAVEVHLLGLTWRTSGIALWSYSTGLSMLIVVVLAPVLGAIADLARQKRGFLAACTFAGALFTAGLVLVGPGDYLLCSGLYIVANTLWSAANIFYDGFLPELTDDPRRMDSISAAGYAVGYLGGGLALLLSLVLIANPGLFGLGAGGATRASFLLVAAWWAVFTVPLLRHVPETRSEGGPPPGGYVRAGLGRLATTLRKVRRLPNLARMLVAFLLYNSGIGTIIVIAAAYGSDELHLPDATLVGCILLIQFLGLPATFAYIALAKKLGTRASIHTGLFVYMGVVVYAMLIDSELEFWILGVLVALVQGGTQAMSRSLYGSMIPAGMTAEFFGFFSIFNKVGPFLGPVFFAVVKDLTGSSRSAILFLIVFFVLGAAALFTVHVEAGRAQAEAYVHEG